MQFERPALLVLEGVLLREALSSHSEDSVRLILHCEKHPQLREVLAGTSFVTIEWANGSLHVTVSEIFEIDTPPIGVDC